MTYMLMNDEYPQYCFKFQESTKNYLLTLSSQRFELIINRIKNISGQ